MELLDELGISGVPAITVLCFLAAEILKKITAMRKWIPEFCAALGCLLGLAAMFVVPDYPSENIFTALAVGTVSGFAATGVHRVHSRITEEKAEKPQMEEEN